MQSSVENDLAQAKRVWLEKNRQVSGQTGGKKKGKESPGRSMRSIGMQHVPSIRHQNCPVLLVISRKSSAEEGPVCSPRLTMDRKRPNNIFFVRARCLSAGHGT